MTIEAQRLTSRAIDLSMEISPAMPVNAPDHSAPVFREYASIAEQGWNGTELTLDSHCGTHVDAPSHFVPGRAAIDEVPLEALNGWAQRIGLDTLRAASAEDDKGVTAAFGQRVIVHTGASESLPHDEQKFLTGYPYLSEVMARELVRQGVRVVGVDAPSVDAPGVDEVHHILLENGICIIENMVNTAALPNEFWLSVLPLRLKGCDGSPVRAAAFVSGS